MKSFLTFAEELKGKQHKIDADKDGKIEAEDLAKLRAMKKEETEQIDELKKSTLASYAKKASKDARIKSMVSKDLEHRSETSRKDSNKTSFSNAATDWKKKAWKREAGVNKAVDRLTKEEVAKATGDLKDACWKGYTAVGMKMKNGKKVPNCVPVKEDSDLEEKIDMNKASMGDVIKDFKKSDAPQFAGKSVEKRREMAIAAKLSADRGVREEVKPMKPPFNAPYKKAAGDTKDKSGAVHTAASRAKHLAKTGMKTQTPVKEGVFGALAGGVLGGLAGGPLGAAAGAYLGHKAQQAGNNAKEVNKKLKKEEVEQIDELSFNTLASYASKVDQKDKQPLSKKRQAGYNSAVERMSKAAQTADLKKWGKISDSVEYNFDNEGNLMPNPVSFKQFLGQLDEIKMADLPSRKVSGRGYGTEYYKKEAEKDKSGYDDEKKEKSEVKRGRGRPVGSTSGARQKGSTTGKKRSGVEMTGYPLHLPNKN
jgi:hypothetical protein